MITPARLSASQFASSTSTPPPVEITLGNGPWHCGIAEIAGQKSYRFALELSELRFTVVGKNLRDRLFARATITASLSMNSHPRRRATIGPTELFPVAMNPVRISLGVILKKRRSCERLS